MYALAIHGLMVIIARFLFGTTNGLSLVLAQAYIGWIARENKHKNGPSIEKLLLFYSITISVSLIAATGQLSSSHICTNINHVIIIPSTHFLSLSLIFHLHSPLCILPDTNFPSLLASFTYCSNRNVSTDVTVPVCQSVSVGRMVYICCGSSLHFHLSNCIFQH